MKIRKLRDAEGETWEGNDEIGWTWLDTEPELDDEPFVLRNYNVLWVLYGPLTEIEDV